MKLVCLTHVRATLVATVNVFAQQFMLMLKNVIDLVFIFIGDRKAFVVSLMNVKQCVIKSRSNKMQVLYIEN